MNIAFFPLLSHSTIIRLYIPTGSSRDGEKMGLAHLAEHCVAKILEQKINETYKTTWVDHHVATHFDATTSRSYTCFSFDVHTTYTREVLQLIKNTFYSFISPEMVKHEKELIVSEIEHAEEEEQKMITEDISKAFQGEFAWKHAILGNKKSVLNISSDDVKKFIASEYIPNMSCLVISGNISSEIKKYAVKLFETKTKIPKNIISCKGGKQTREKRKVRKIKMGNSQAHITWLASLSINNEKENTIWEFIRFMLHDYMRFFLSSRNSFAYYTYSEFAVERGASMFSLSAVVPKNKKENVLRIVEDALKNIETYCTKQEFETAKKAFLYESLIDKDYPITQAKNIGWTAMIFGIDALKKMDEEKIISNITRKDVIKRVELFAKNHHIHIAE